MVSGTPFVTADHAGEEEVPHVPGILEGARWAPRRPSGPASLQQDPARLVGRVEDLSAVAQGLAHQAGAIPAPGGPSFPASVVGSGRAGEYLGGHRNRHAKGARELVEHHRIELDRR
jgi:hypothetical protein